MGRCCGGKNAGKPISWGRYLTGVGVFCAYHGTVGAVLHAAAVPVPALRKVRDFHREVSLRDLGEILRREDIVVGRAIAEDAACPVQPAVAQGESDQAAAPDAVRLA